MNVVLYNIDNVYRYPNFRGRGKICKTNVPVGVPMRATGVAASVAVQETVISHVATAVQLPEEKVDFDYQWTLEIKSSFITHD